MQHRFWTSAVAPVALLALASTVRAQGGDNCSAPTVITGTGVFPVSTVGATNGAPDSSGCTSTQVAVWFHWTAPHTTFSISGLPRGLSNYRAYAPVPEPETYAMFLAGLGMMGAVARRRGARKA